MKYIFTLILMAVLPSSTQIGKWTALESSDTPSHYLPAVVFTEDYEVLSTHRICGYVTATNWANGVTRYSTHIYSRLKGAPESNVGDFTTKETAEKAVEKACK